MRISDPKIIESFNYAVEAGHPDPIGFIARGQIKTGLDYEKEFKGAVGTFGVDEKQAKKLGYDREDLELTETNFRAALEVDMNNLRAAEGDLDEMYRRSNSGSKQGTDRFISRLGKERDKISDSMVFENGVLTSISQKEEEEKEPEDVSGLDTPEDVKEETQTLEFQQADKERVDGLLTKLIKNIVDEKDIDG